MPAPHEQLTYVVWEITLKCDLQCGHCGSRAGHARPDELSTAEALDVVKQLAAMGAGEVTLIGGEAYLRDDWLVIARAIVDAGMRCGMTTGGRGLTLERARAAKEAGMGSVSVSVDGIGAAHDEQRSLSGSYDAAMTALENLRAAGLKASANTQLNHLSLPHLDELLDRFIELSVTGWQVQLTVPMGRAAEQPQWLLQPYELLDLYPRLAALAERGRRHGVLMWPANNIGYFGPHEATIRGRGEPSELFWSGCIAGAQALGIESDGTIKGCPSLPTSSYAGGNVRDKSIQQIWQQSAALRYTRDRSVEDLWGYCRSCYYADDCRAGCTWTSQVILGRPGNNPYCHHRALMHERMGKRERLVKVEAAPGVPFDHGRFEIVVEPNDAPLPSRRKLPLLKSA